MINRALINPQILTDIADSIRGKTGKTEPIKVSQMASEIGGITTGGSSGGNVYRNLTTNQTFTSVGTERTFSCAYEIMQ